MKNINNIHREAPWDAKVFGMSCCELVALSSDLDVLDSKIDRLICEFDFTYGRVKAEDIELRNLLTNKGFVGAEVSALAKLTKLHKQNISQKAPIGISLKKLSASLEHEVIETADRMYEFSRFHESPFVDIELARLRMKNWVKDLIMSSTPCLALVSNHHDNEKLLGYMFFTHEKNKANLLLGGVLKGEEIHALTLWKQVLVKLQSYDIKVVTARVSLSNNGVVKLYQHFGFQLTDFLIDYQLVNK